MICKTCKFRTTIHYRDALKREQEIDYCGRIHLPCHEYSECGLYVVGKGDSVEVTKEKTDNNVTLIAKAERARIAKIAEQGKTD